jgi:hypothetical protein
MSREDEEQEREALKAGLSVNIQTVMATKAALAAKDYFMALTTPAFDGDHAFSEEEALDILKATLHLVVR